MLIQIERQDDGVLVRLEGELSIYSIAELKTTLSEVLAEDARVALDLSGVEDIDTAGIQLLLALKRAAEHRHKHLAFLHQSGPVLQLIDLYNLGGALKASTSTH
jgi:anti-anti-sigma factor